MGACNFFHEASGMSAKEAFKSARDEALYDYGHAGYTGTIAEKDAFIMIEAPPGVEPGAYAEQLLLDDDERVEDKWGPAGCIKMGEGKYLFFGWAST